MFDLNQAKENSNEGRVNYQAPGIYNNVKVTEVTLGTSSRKGSPFIKLSTESEEGAKGNSVEMYLNTVPSKEGAKYSGWSITARNIIDLIMATHNVTEEVAKTTANFGTLTSNEDLQNRLTNLLVGKPFRAKFRGECTQKGNIYATLDKVESMRVDPTRLTYNAARDIKPYVAYDGAVAVTTDKTDDLPF